MTDNVVLGPLWDAVCEVPSLIALILFAKGLLLFYGSKWLAISGWRLRSTLSSDKKPVPDTFTSWVLGEIAEANLSPTGDNLHCPSGAVVLSANGGYTLHMGGKPMWHKIPLGYQYLVHDAARDRLAMLGVEREAKERQELPKRVDALEAVLEGLTAPKGPTLSEAMGSLRDPGTAQPGARGPYNSPSGKR